MTVIDLEASPPVVLATLHAGKGASGVSINRAGTLALVANRFDGTVSVFTIAGKTVTAAGTVEVGTPESLLSGVVFTRDGRTALVTRNNDSLMSVLSMAARSRTRSATSPPTSSRTASTSRHPARPRSSPASASAPRAAPTR